MLFKRIDSPDDLNQIIECYWIIEDSDKTPKCKKIIPDGYPELIFHYANPYRISLNGAWEIQSQNLVGGQISKHFFLENTGASGILGVKLKPTALSHLFNLSMDTLTDKVVPAEALDDTIRLLGESVQDPGSFDDKIKLINNYFLGLLSSREIKPSQADQAVDIILKHHGMISVAAIGETLSIGERQLQYLFRKYVGLSPKFYARIIRFNYIFELIQQEHTWTDLAYEASYYDQSHFIRNFKNFTGENPGEYDFDEKNMANFFLKKTSL